MDMPYHQHLQQPAFMVICDDCCDQICGSKAEAEREKADLIRMGFERRSVKVKSFATWQEAHAYEDQM